ncbi:hypothetical protein [Mesorhizobium quangtriensis]|uniref:hypothetical protein n=1 Tax=Mesorhizobium quangtriensis TaxID=3157709 RepID=UPI003CCCD16B
MSNAHLNRNETRAAKFCVPFVMVVAIAAGCTSTPTDYAATLSQQDPKWMSPECQDIRATAANYKEQKVSWAAGALIGPYGLALVAAGKEHQEKQRVKMAREMHLKCSSQPLPKNLKERPVAQQKIK